MKNQFAELAPVLRRFLRRNRILSALAALASVALFTVVILFLTDWYPIMLVNGTPVSANRFYKNLSAANIYFGNLLKSAEGNQENLDLLRQTTPDDIAVGVLDQLVVSVLVEAGARTEVGSDLARLVSERIGERATTEKIKRGAEILYGMRNEDFYEEVLVPQAKQDILEGRLYLRGQDFGNWLASERAAANVRIFSSKFRWDGSRVLAN